MKMVMKEAGSAPALKEGLEYLVQLIPFFSAVSAMFYLHQRQESQALEDKKSVKDSEVANYSWKLNISWIRHRQRE